MDKTNENLSLPEAENNQHENLPSSTSTSMNLDQAPESGETGGILLEKESKTNANLEAEERKTARDAMIEKLENDFYKCNEADEQLFTVGAAKKYLERVLVAYDNTDSSDSEEEMAENADKNKTEKNDVDSSSSDSDTDSSSEDNEAANNKSAPKPKNPESDSSDSETDSSCTLSSDSDNDDDSDTESNPTSVVDLENKNTETKPTSTNKGAVKKTYTTNVNITGFEETDCIPIPDISNLNINEEEEFMLIGTISHIIAEIVTVTVIRGTPAFDLDSMLFTEYQNGKKPMGPIFDVIGPVADPIYCVRFNSKEEIEKLGLKSGMKVFAAPKSEQFTKFVFLPELLKMKHSDASYRNDTELPTDMAEFSDDEKEREARRKKIGNKRKINDNSLERHKKYERSMNRSNNLYTKFCKMGGDNRCKVIINTEIPPEFDPTVPPPGFVNRHHYPGDTTLMQQHESMYEYYRAAIHAMDNSSNVYASELEFAHQFVPPAPGDYDPSQVQPMNNYFNPSQNFAFTNNARNTRGPGPSSQPF